MIEKKDIIGSRRRVFICFIITLMFFSFGLIAEYILLWIISGIFIILSMCMLVKPQRIHIDAEGFNVSGGLISRSSKVPWHDVSDFLIFHIPSSGDYIGYKYKPGVHKASALRKLNRSFFGADGMVLSTSGWLQSPQSIVDELNAYRMQAMIKGDVAVSAQRPPCDLVCARLFEVA